MKTVVFCLIIFAAIAVLFGAILLQKPKKTKEGFAFAYTTEEIGIGVGAGVGLLVILILVAFFLLSYAFPKKVKVNAPKGWPVPFNME